MLSVGVSVCKMPIMNRGQLSRPRSPDRFGSQGLGLPPFDRTPAERESGMPFSRDEFVWSDLDLHHGRRRAGDCSRTAC